MKKLKVILPIILLTMLAIVNIYSMKSGEFQGQHLFQLSIMPSYAQTEMPCSEIKDCYDKYDKEEEQGVFSSWKRVCEKPDGTVCAMYYGYNWDNQVTCCND